MSTQNRYSPEVRARAVRMVFEHQGKHESQRAAIGSIAGKIGCTAETLRKWVRQAERDQGKRAGLSSSEPERPGDLVKRQFEATHPNQLWVADFTYFATWAGFV